MIRAFVLFYVSMEFWKRQYENGDAPDGLPYGLQHLQDHDIELDYSDIAQHPAVKLPLRPIERWAFGYDVVQPLLLARRMRKADVILSTLDRQGIFLAWMRSRKLFGLHHVPHVFISTSLAQQVQDMPRHRLDFLRSALSSVDRLVFYSQNQTAIFEDTLGIPRDRLRCIPFGVSSEVFAPSDEPSQDFILSVGWDKGRDYATLLRAVEGLPIEVTIVCSRSNLVGMRIPDNVRIMYHVPISRLKELYRQCRLTVVPTHDFAYPTGQTVVLEAMACDKPVISTANQGMGDYIRHGINGLLVPPGDAAALRETITSALADRELLRSMGRAARQDVEKTFNTAEMARRLADIVREVAVGN